MDDLKHGKRLVALLEDDTSTLRIKTPSGPETRSVGRYEVSSMFFNYGITRLAVALLQWEAVYKARDNQGSNQKDHFTNLVAVNLGSNGLFPSTIDELLESSSDAGIPELRTAKYLIAGDRRTQEAYSRLKELKPDESTTADFASVVAQYQRIPVLYGNNRVMSPSNPQLPQTSMKGSR